MKGQTEADSKTVVLCVPLRADDLATVRLALYGVAVRVRFSYEAIEDLKVAVTEACNYAILQAGDRERLPMLRLVFTLRETELKIRIGTDSPDVTFGEALRPVKLPPEGADALEHLEDSPIGLYLLQALVDELRVEPGGEGASEAIVLIKRLVAE
ncbi:serine/threonine-protein kinase RsbW [Paenibacillus tianmuensis]|uniref:Serine/threonine-protein kinase RsbW n=1 Tax=Paenibacillus tianmuensis TaxID=624147 RepID=A0A1G4TBB8_9BACL|nr:ATP-binding protein [Paenibacillus tianmuensis]SCW78733.1 serine/threonine-protein kinase RsbW [Paenibacillus tianmuensis]